MIENKQLQEFFNEAGWAKAAMHAISKGEHIYPWPGKIKGTVLYFPSDKTLSKAKHISKELLVCMLLEELTI